jgi:hypothetical protein
MATKKKVIKEKKQKKVKQKQSQSQSQKVIINLNEVKNKPKRTRRKSTNKNNKFNEISTNNMGSGWTKYGTQDDREANTLRGNLNEVQNKLLFIPNDEKQAPSFIINQPNYLENYNKVSTPQKTRGRPKLNLTEEELKKKKSEDNKKYRLKQKEKAEEKNKAVKEQFLMRKNDININGLAIPPKKIIFKSYYENLDKAEKEAEEKQLKKTRGRPVGSKNKKTIVINENNVFIPEEKATFNLKTDEKKNNLNKDIINQSKIFELNKKIKEEQKEKEKIKKSNFNKDIINQSKLFELNRKVKDEKKETRKHVNLFMQSQFDVDRLSNNITKDRELYNQFLDDLEQEKENEKKEQAFMRENDKNIKRLGRPKREEQRRRYDVALARKNDDTNFIGNQSNLKDDFL